jgi:superfamily II DNA or RNA helicase
MELHKKKSEIQSEAINIWSVKKKGCLAIATGVGKTKIGVDISIDYDKILIIVPTEKLRDERWPEEYSKWKKKTFFNSHVEKYCYASLLNIKDLNQYDLIIFDEAHNITINNHVNLKKYKGDILALTATPPRDEEKQEIFKKYFPVCFEYGVDEAVGDKVVAPYKINIVQYYLDSSTKNIEAGNKTKRFMTTELANYNYMNNVINKIRYSGKPVSKFFYLNRMRFLYNLPSKTRIAKKILNNITTNKYLL